MQPRECSSCGWAEAAKTKLWDVDERALSIWQRWSMENLYETAGDNSTDYIPHPLGGLKQAMTCQYCTQNWKGLAQPSRKTSTKTVQRKL